ncbi:hypothetical protein QFC19_008682 [Naganishia cerealis]|uniref:Uncharacterized protein n=1 Tax=Naganishia cerealis TaxID=610337 RepID=A0ACC2UZR6_9TREE|nr:hypothetical protein QFC19_008682 [Naganishia cerealis]
MHIYAWVVVQFRLLLGSDHVFLFAPSLPVRVPSHPPNVLVYGKDVTKVTSELRSVIRKSAFGRVVISDVCSIGSINTGNIFLVIEKDIRGVSTIAETTRAHPIFIKIGVTDSGREIFVKEPFICGTCGRWWDGAHGPDNLCTVKSWVLGPEVKSNAATNKVATAANAAPIASHAPAPQGNNNTERGCGKKGSGPYNGAKKGNNKGKGVAKGKGGAK